MSLMTASERDTAARFWLKGLEAYPPVFVHLTSEQEQIYYNNGMDNFHVENLSLLAIASQHKELKASVDFLVDSYEECGAFQLGTPLCDLYWRLNELLITVYFSLHND